MTVPPPPVNPFVSVQSLSTTAVSQDSSQLPPALANARNGQVIEGFVVNRDANQNPILRTPQGDLLIRSEVFLRTGSTVQIRVDVQLESRARIVLIDGLSPEAYVRNQPQRNQSDVILPSSIASNNTATQAGRGQTAQSITLPALLLSSQPGQGNTSNASSALSAALTGSTTPTSASTANSNVQITILSITPPSNAPNASALLASDFLQAAPNQTNTSSLNTAPTATNAPNNTGAPNVTAPNLTANNPASTSTANISSAPNAPVTTPNNTAATSTSPTTQATQTSAPPAHAQAPASAPTNNQTITAKTTNTTASTNITTPQPPVTTSQTPPTTPATPAPAQNIPATPSPSAPNTATSSNTPAANANTASPAQATPTPTPTASPSNVSGELARVINQDPDGASIIQLGNQNYKLFTSRPLPIGAELRVSITPSALPTESTTLPPRLVEFSTLTRHWPALDEAANLILAAQGSTPNISVNQLAPNVGPSLTADMLFFLAAVRGGDLTNFWPRQVVQFIQQKQPDLLQRLQTDSVQMQQLAQPQPYPNWSVFLLPLFFGEHADQVRLYLREDHPEGEQQEEDGQSQRFIMELELSHIGEMQLDGLVRGNQSAKPSRFDLIIRSAKALDETVEADIEAIYSGALKQTDMTGNIRFQHGRHLFANPAGELAETDDNPKDGGDFDFTILA